MFLHYLYDFFENKIPVFLLKKPVLLACSGGPDSVALAHGLAKLAKEYGLQPVLVHVHHHLRGRESDQDARFVRSLAKKLGFPYQEHHLPKSLREGGNLEERARVLRYDALLESARKWKAKLILTAHHQDDVVETLFMNLLRGTGPSGLKGMAALRPLGTSSVQLGRPLLETPREEIARFLKENKLSYRRDSSNKDTRFFRNWIRWNIFPELEKKSPQFRKSLARLASIFRDEEEYWDREIRSIYRRMMGNSGSFPILDFKRLLRYSGPVQRRLLRYVVGDGGLTFERLEHLRSWMSSPPSSGKIFELKKGNYVERLSKSKGASSAHLFKFRIKPMKGKL